MRAAAPRTAPPDQAPYAAAEAAFAEAKAYLSSREARQMSESDLERALHRRGQELMRKLLQGHLDQRSPGEAAGPVEGADDVERSERRVHERHLETTFGTVQVERLGYAHPGHDAASSMPRSTCRRSVTRSRCGAAWRRRPRRGPLTKRSSSCLAVPGHRYPSVRRNSWWFERLRTSTPSTRHAVRRLASRPPRGRLSCSPLTARAWCCIARICARRRARRPRSAGSTGSSSPGSSASSRERRGTRSAWRRWPPHGRAVRAGPEEFLESMPRPPGAKPRVVRPRPVAKRVWASLEREPWEVVAEATLEAERQDPACQALGRARRWRRDAARPRGSGRRRLRRGRHGDTRHHPRGRVRLEGGACVPPRGEPRVGVLGLDAPARHSRGQGQQGGGGDACGDRRRLLERHPQAGRYVRRLPAEIRAVSALRPLPRGRSPPASSKGRAGTWSATGWS